MDDRERERAQLIISQDTKLARKDMAGRIEQALRQNAASGRLASGNSIQIALEEIRDATMALLSTLKTKLLNIGVDVQFHDLIKEAILDFSHTAERYLYDNLLPKIGLRIDERLENHIHHQLDEQKTNLETALAIARFEFQPADSSVPAVPASQGAQRNLGGRPTAYFWDELWAAIAADLYHGDLKPRTQADIENAMADWITHHGRNAANSTVQLRARMLWRQVKP